MKGIRVEKIAQLRTQANNFQNHADAIKSVTTNMLNLVEQTKSVWEGMAQTTYSTNFAGLSDDMERLYAMCSEYSEDLIQIADTYQAAADINDDTARTLKTDIEIMHS